MQVRHQGQEHRCGAAAGPDRSSSDFNDKPTTFNTPACGPSGGERLARARERRALNAGRDLDGAGDDARRSERRHAGRLQRGQHGVDRLNPARWPTRVTVSQAEQKVPQLFINLGPGPVYVYCDPPSIALEKTATKTAKAGDGYDATFRIKVTSTGPDPYHGTVELERSAAGRRDLCVEQLAVRADDRTTTCIARRPTRTSPVGKYTTMTITIHIPEDVAKEREVRGRQHRRTRRSRPRCCTATKGAVHGVGGGEAAGERVPRRGRAAAVPDQPADAGWRMLRDGRGVERQAVRAAAASVPGRQPHQQCRQVRVR